MHIPVEIVYAIKTSSIEFVLQEGSEFFTRTSSGASIYLAIPVRLRRKTRMSTVVSMTSEMTMSAKAIENSHWGSIRQSAGCAPWKTRGTHSELAELAVGG